MSFFLVRDSRLSHFQEFDLINMQVSERRSLPVHHENGCFGVGHVRNTRNGARICSQFGAFCQEDNIEVLVWERLRKFEAHRSMYPSIHLAIYGSLYLFILISIDLSVYLSISLCTSISSCWMYIYEQGPRIHHFFSANFRWIDFILGWYIHIWHWILLLPDLDFPTFFSGIQKRTKMAGSEKTPTRIFFGTMKLSFPNSDRFLWKSRCFFFGAISVFDFPFKPGNTWAKFGEFMTGDFAIFASDFVNFSKGFDLGGKKPKMFFLDHCFQLFYGF